MESKDINYRFASVDDAVEMITVHFDAVHEISPNIYSMEMKNSWSPNPGKERFSWLVDIINNQNTICHVAINSDKTIVGFSIFLIKERSLKALYISPTYQGHGIGVKLLNLVEYSAFELNISLVILKASLNAESFYEKMGYQKQCDSFQELSNGDKMPSITMEKNLDISA